MIFQIKDPTFTASIVVDDASKVCVKADRIVRRFDGQSLRWISDYCQRHRWSLLEEKQDRSSDGSDTCDTCL